MSLPRPMPVTNTSVDFRAAFRSHPSGVAVITATGSAGAVGLTASSVSSVSADPPVLAFSVSGGRTASYLATTQTLIVHLLRVDQVELARAFADPGAPRFTEHMNWEVLPTGEPLLHDAPWALRCQIIHRATLGKSELLAAAVLDIWGKSSQSDPLVYQDRAFHRLNRTISVI